MKPKKIHIKRDIDLKEYQIWDIIKLERKQFIVWTDKDFKLILLPYPLKRYY